MTRLLPLLLLLAACTGASEDKSDDTGTPADDTSGGDTDTPACDMLNSGDDWT